MRATTENSMSFRSSARLTLLVALILGVYAGVAQAKDGKARHDWPSFTGSLHADRYSPLKQIDRTNVGQVKVAWRRAAIDASVLARWPDAVASAYFRPTPIALDGILYAPNGTGLVEAFDGATGETLWVQQIPGATLRDIVGNSSRGVDSWRRGGDFRIFSVKGSWLYAINGHDGSAITGFGDGGRVSLRRDTPSNLAYFGINGPLVVGNAIIVAGNGGGNAGDAGLRAESTPEDIRAYNVESGALLWTFALLPAEGQAERASWGGDSARTAGTMGAWAPLSADAERGIVYVPTSAPVGYYGGARPGDNIYSNSLVALDAKTGQKLWYHQLVRHDVWDYDVASAPTLGRITVNRKTIDAVFQPTKAASLFVFDRVTGVPVWPIENRPVPASAVPGEVMSPTQPFPTKPPPFDRQTISEADLIDFTPELRKEAMGIAARYTLGDVFTPPALRGADGKQGVLVAPGAWGAGNWNTGAFDPETGHFYAVSTTIPGVYALDKTESERSTIAYGLLGKDPDPPAETNYGIGPRGLPLLKPPYGRITAYDMNRGEIAWMNANGDGPRNHPELKGLDLPPLGTVGRPVPLVTGSLLFVGESSDAIYGEQGIAGPSTFYAYDKADGSVLARIPLPAGQTAGPMTYVAKGRQYVVVSVGARGHAPEWIALAVGGDAQ